MLPQSLPHLTLRPASNDDLKTIVKLVFGVLREFGLQPGGTNADLQDIETNYSQRGLFEVNKQRTVRGDHPETLRRCFNPMSHVGTHAQQSSLCDAF